VPNIADVKLENMLEYRLRLCDVATFLYSPKFSSDIVPFYISSQKINFVH